MKAKKILTLLHSWMQTATVEEKRQLAKSIGTSYEMMFQYAAGERQVSPQRAAEIERATAWMHKANPNLPELYRTDLAVACAQCEYAQTCLGQKAIRAEFPLEQ